VRVTRLAQLPRAVVLVGRGGGGGGGGIGLELAVELLRDRAHLLEQRACGEHGRGEAAAVARKPLQPAAHVLAGDGAQRLVEGGGRVELHQLLGVADVLGHLR